MVNSLERYKVLKAINTYGQIYQFHFKSKNEFNEPTGGESSFTLRGIYHETQGYVTSTASDGSNVKTKPNSLILCMKEDASQIAVGMTTEIREKEYRVVDLRDVENLGLFYDISLEVVLPE